MTGLLEKAKDNVKKVYEAGKKAEYDAFWDAYQQNGERERYSYAFTGGCWAGMDLAKIIKYDIKPVETKANQNYIQGMFFEFNKQGSGNYDMTEFCKRLDFSECFNAESVFRNARADNITVDFRNAISLNMTFGGGNAGSTFETINLRVTEKCTNFYNCFYYCQQLANLRFMEGSAIAANIEFKQSKKLSKESIESIINALSDTKEGLTVTFSKEAVNTAFGIDIDDEATWTDEWKNLIATKQNWIFSFA